MDINVCAFTTHKCLGLLRIFTVHPGLRVNRQGFAALLLVARLFSPCYATDLLRAMFVLLHLPVAGCCVAWLASAVAVRGFSPKLVRFLSVYLIS